MFKYVYDRFMTGVSALSFFAAASATLLVAGCPTVNPVFPVVSGVPKCERDENQCITNLPCEDSDGTVRDLGEDPCAGRPQPSCIELINTVSVFPSSSRSILIRDDKDAGHAQLTVTASSGATSFTWCVQREDPSKHPNGLGLLEFDPPLGDDGCVTTTPDSAGGLTGHVDITKVIGDPGPGNAEHVGEQVTIAVLATLQPVDEQGRPVPCDVPGGAPITLQVRRPEGTLLAVLTADGSGRVAPRGEIMLTAEITGGKPFLDQAPECAAHPTCPTSDAGNDNPGPYRVEWSLNEGGLLPRVAPNDVRLRVAGLCSEGAVTRSISCYRPDIAVGDVRIEFFATDAEGNRVGQTQNISVESPQQLTGILVPGQSAVQLQGATSVTTTIRGGTPPYDACWFLVATGANPNDPPSTGTLTIGGSECKDTLRTQIRRMTSVDQNVRDQLDKFLLGASFCRCNLANQGSEFNNADIDVPGDYTAPNEGAAISMEVRVVDEVLATASNKTSLDISQSAGAACGDGVKQASEECDTRGDTAQCDRDCTLPKNGDGLVNAAFGEECDDGNTIDTDGCRNNGKLAVCADGVVQARVEECDNGAGNSNAPDAACRPDCKRRRCGDGVEDPAAGEQCDDGNASDVDACVGACKDARCGDGFLWLDGGTEQCDPPNPAARCEVGCVLRDCGNGADTDPGEECDDGDFDNTDACLNNCQDACCGDGVILVGVEECDGGGAADCTTAVDTAVDTPICNGAAAPNPCRLSSCGDNYVNTAAGEECDDGNNSDTDACRNNCKTAGCGDGVVRAGAEECDDGNIVDTDACRNNCQDAECGDGVIRTGVEECDDANNVDNDGCRNNCKLPKCGDGVEQGAEECDDGNTIDTDACRNNCQDAECGDGVVRAGPEECDDGNNIDTDACRNNCHVAFCGDGVVRAGVEECDDGNSTDTDACRNNCQNAECGDGVVRAGVEQCDDGNNIDTDACRNNCNTAACGDGVVRAGVEECDDGNSTDTDACRNNCQDAECGDGVERTGVEECDDGNTIDSDTCRNNCKDAFCGDGVRQVGLEQCDDAGESAACDDDCTFARCGDGKRNSSANEVCDDGNENNGDGCKSNCRDTETGFTCTGSAPTICTPICGDGMVVGGELCDDGFADACGTCNATCSGPGSGSVCGDGDLCPETEDCDDGNILDGDACPGDCTIP
ncbi:MAG: DUF4215 domain-containing protein [Planctomycetota bacterium]